MKTKLEKRVEALESELKRQGEVLNKALALLDELLNGEEEEEAPEEVVPDEAPPEEEEVNPDDVDTSKIERRPLY